MKTRFLFLSALMGVLPMTMAAQDDDLYFNPKKSPKTELPAQRDGFTYDRPGYYCGSNRDIDEYNRRGKLKSYYQKIGTDSLGNDIIEFRQGDGTYGTADLDSTITIYPGSERYYDDNDSDFAYSRRMGRFDGFYGYWDPTLYGTYWGSPYWRGYYGWYDPWYGPYYYSGWYGGWYDPWYYGYGWGYPYYGWGGWYAPSWHYSYGGPTGTRNHSTFTGGSASNGTTFGRRNNYGSGSTSGNVESRWFGRNNSNSSSNSNNDGFGRRNNQQQNSYQYQQQRQSTSFGNSNNGFGSSRGSFGGGSGFGGSRGSFGGGGGFGGGGSRGGFGGRR